MPGSSVFSNFHQPSFPSLLDNSSRNNWKQTRNKLIIPHSISLLLSVSLGKYWFLPFPTSLLPFSLELILVRFSSLTAGVNHSHVSISPGIKAESLQWPTRPYMIPAWTGLPSSLPLSSHCSMERPGQLFCGSDQGERTWRIYVTTGPLRPGYLQDPEILQLSPHIPEAVSRSERWEQEDIGCLSISA